MKIIDIWNNESVAQIVIELLEPHVLSGCIYPDDDGVSGRWNNLGKILSKQNNLDAKLISVECGRSDFPGWLGVRQQFQLTYKKVAHLSEGNPTELPHYSI